MGRTADRWSASLALIIILCLFCGPLFIGLGRWDLQSDEAGYSYAIDRMLETGDWMTPRQIRFDTPLLDKPPLKLWIVAGAIQSGLLPHDEFGFRFIDALLGGFAFVYVFWIGHWLAGPLCGVAAILVLFTFPPLLFDHGLRSNNMDAALMLAYCGGIFHFAAWVENGGRRRTPVHAWAAVAYVVLGFMTKFVAVAFLPLVWVLGLWWRSDGRIRLHSHWRDWVVPSLVAAALITPWFAYQAVHADQRLWQTMWVEQVYARFTGVIDARQLLPWHYYVSRLYSEMASVGSHWIAILGGLMLGVRAWQGRSWLARLLLLWLIVPLALLSLGTSKFFHYTYPFLPPLALGAGAAAAAIFRAIHRTLARAEASATTKLGHVVLRSWIEWALVAAAVLAVTLSIWTALEGRVQLGFAGVDLLRNSSIVRPLLVAAILLGISRHRWIAARALAMAPVAVVLPVNAYTLTVNHLSSVDHDLRAVSGCAMMVRDARLETHVYVQSYYDLLDHTPYFYLRRVGPWIEHTERLTNDEFDSRISAPGDQTLVILSSREYDVFAQQLAQRELPVPAAVALPFQGVLVTPGPFETCAEAAVAAGGRRIDEP